MLLKAAKEKKMKYIPLGGRILFSLIFIMASFNHFTKGAIEYAASNGTPMASIAVPVSGVMSLLGGLSILIGYRAKWGALLIILFLIPVTFYMHAFWKIDDAMARGMQMAMFMKNLAMMGGAMFIYYFGTGPMSLDKEK